MPGSALARLGGRPDVLLGTIRLVNGIAAHHDEVPLESVEAVLVQAADACSAADWASDARAAIAGAVTKSREIGGWNFSTKDVLKNAANQKRALRQMMDRVLFGRRSSRGS